MAGPITFDDLRSRVPANTLVVDANGTFGYKTVQAAIDAAVAKGATVSNPWRVEYGPDVDPAVARDAQGNVTTTGGASAAGVELVYTGSMAEEDKPLAIKFSSGVPFALRVDDGKDSWSNEEAGLTINDGQFLAGDGWVTGANVLAFPLDSTYVWPNPGSTRTLRNNIGGGTPMTGTVVYKAGALNLSGYNYLSIAVYSPGRLMGKDELALAFSAAADLSAPVTVGLPSVVKQDRWCFICVAIPAAVRAITIASYGLVVTGMPDGKDIRVNNWKATVLGVDGTCESYGTSILGRTEKPPIAQLTPAGYAASKGVPVTHCIPQSLVGTTNYMTPFDIRMQALRFGCEIAAHGNEHSTMPATYAGLLAESKGVRNYLESLSDATGIPRFDNTPATPHSKLGLRVRGYIQPGTFTGQSVQDATADLYRTLGVLLRRYYAWSMGYRGQPGPDNRYFGAYPTGMTLTKLQYYLKRPQVLLMHGIGSGGGADTTFANFKAIVDYIALLMQHGVLTPLTLTDFMRTRYLPLAGQKEYFAATYENDDGVCTVTLHGLQPNDAITVESTTGGLTVGATYYVVDDDTLTANAFTLSATVGGAALTGGGDATLRLSRPLFGTLVENGDVTAALSAGVPLGAVTYTTRQANGGIYDSPCLKIGNDTNAAARASYAISCDGEDMCFGFKAIGSGRTPLWIWVYAYKSTDDGTGAYTGYQVTLLSCVPRTRYDQCFVRMQLPVWADRITLFFDRPTTSADDTDPIYIDDIRRM